MTEVTVTSRDFDDVKNPYTGKTMVVKMIVGAGPDPLFHAPDEFSTSSLQKTTKDLYRLWGRVDGLEGLRNGAPKCAYSGEPLTVRETEGMFYFEGGFDPKRFYTRDEFLYLATMRDGKPTRSKPGPSSRVTKPNDEVAPSEGQKRHAESVTPGVSQESIEAAEKAIDAHRDGLNLPAKLGWRKGRR